MKLESQTFANMRKLWRFKSTYLSLRIKIVGGSPGLVVMGSNLHYEGCGFESQHHILYGHFFTCICCKNCNDVHLKRPKINEKEAGVDPFFKKKNTN